MTINDDILKKNLEAYSNRSTGIDDLIREHEPQDVEFINSSSDDLVMLYQGMPVQSLEDPFQEAEEILSNIDSKEYDCIHIMFGLGAGYLLKQTLKECKGTIVVYEPSLDILAATFRNIDLTELFKTKYLFIINDINFLKRTIAPFYYMGDKVGLITSTFYRLMFPEEYEEIQKKANDICRDAIINQSTVMNKSKRWTLAALNNIFSVLKSPNCMGLKGKLKDVPAVVVSAGPSLELVIDKLRENQDKIFIVAVGQALKALDKAGIKPHAAAVIENLNVSQQFEGLSFLKDLNVVLQPMTHKSIYDLPVKTFLINFPGGDSISNWYGKATGKNIDGFFNKGTVSATAFYIAQTAGCNPIMLAGQDLAFRDGKRYAANTSYDSLKYTVDENGKIKFTKDEDSYEKFGKSFEMTKEEFEQRDKTVANEVIETKDWDGNPIYTIMSYSLFMNNFSDIARHELPLTGQRLINTSERGAYIKDLEHLTFSEALKECNLDHNININSSIEDVIKEYIVTPEDYQNLYKAIKKTIYELKEASKIASKAMEHAKTVQKELERPKINENAVDRMNARLGKMEKQMIDLLKQNQLINPFIQQELFNYSKTYNRQSEIDRPEDVIEDLKSNIEHSIKLYEAVVNGATQVNEVLPEVLENNKPLVEETKVK